MEYVGAIRDSCTRIYFGVLSPTKWSLLQRLGALNPTAWGDGQAVSLSFRVVYYLNNYAYVKIL